jgi:hypothetical protein
MIEALRRLLWLVPLVALGAFGLFVALSQSPRVREHQSWPLIYNPHPKSARSVAQGAIEDILAGKPGAAARLRRLGGAALPHVLPRLAALSIGDRRLVTEALIPLRHRLERVRQGPLLSPDSFRRIQPGDEDLVYWERFYQEHDLDFRPISVARLTRRLAERSLNLRQGDLLVLDTYALPYLVSQLGRVTTSADVERIARLVPLIARATNRSYELPKGASVDEARNLTTQIRRDWDRIGPKWTQLDRFETLAARLSQTEFAVWVFRTGRALTGLDTPVLLQRITDESGVSPLLLVVAALGALLLGPALATLLSLLWITQSLTRSHRETRTALGIGLCLLVPGTLLHAPDNRLLSAGLTLLVSTLSSTYLLHKELKDRIDWRSRGVLASRTPRERLAAMIRWLAPSIPTFAPIFVAEIFLWMGCIELSSSLEGWGKTTALAYQRGDIEFLMAVCLSLGLLTAALQLVADASLGNARFQRGES